MAVRILSVVGARPNFIKIAPFVRALALATDSLGTAQGCQSDRVAKTVSHVLVHTGQHYDPNMSASFFRELGIPEPDLNLGIGSGSHASQMGRTMIEFEQVLLAERPDWVVVVGDVNATAACSLVARQCGVRVAHIEAGLRSFDWTMPEEINRVVTDRVSNLLLTPDHLADENLRREGVADDAICRVGNIMIDTLEYERHAAASLDPREILIRAIISSAPYGEPSLAIPSMHNVDLICAHDYAIITLHRPSNVDHADSWQRILQAIRAIATEMPIVFPIHPRAKARLAEIGLWDAACRIPNLLLTQPLTYRELLRLHMSARVVLTDSGGLQEEALILGKPCLTLRSNTERPATLVENGGTNRLVGTDPINIAVAFYEALGNPCVPRRPPLWDGHTAERICARLLS